MLLGVKGKSVPLQAWSGPEGSRKLRFPDFMTTAQDGGRKGWKEEVERDLQVLGVRRGRELVADRKKWKDIVRQSKAHSGL